MHTRAHADWPVQSLTAVVVVAAAAAVIAAVLVATVVITVVAVGIFHIDANMMATGRGAAMTLSHSSFSTASISVLSFTRHARYEKCSAVQGRAGARHLH